ncbi:hypothetical protein E2I00_006051, partial [Balaenoptera physalus]
WQQEGLVVHGPDWPCSALGLAGDQAENQGTTWDPIGTGSRPRSCLPGDPRLEDTPLCWTVRPDAWRKKPGSGSGHFSLGDQAVYAPRAARAQQCACLLNIFPSRLCGLGGTNMQGQRELGGAPGHMPPRCAFLNLGEHSGAWGEFEGFRESSARSEQFSQSFELPERPTEPQPPRTISAQEERGSRQSHQGGPGVTGTSAITPSEPIVNYEKIFRFAFQEVPVPQATEDVSTFDHFLETSNEEKLGLESVHKLSESRKLWRALQNTRTVMTSRCLWSESRCRENFLLVLGIDAAQKSLSEGPGRTLGDPGLHEPEELGFRLHRCTALIQTKLSGTPGGRQGRLITYSLFLKTPVRGNGQYITIPRKKKIFTPRNLKMTLFNSDVC